MSITGALRLRRKLSGQTSSTALRPCLQDLRMWALRSIFGCCSELVTPCGAVSGGCSILTDTMAPSLQVAVASYTSDIRKNYNFFVACICIYVCTHTDIHTFICHAPHVHVDR